MNKLLQFIKIRSQSHSIRNLAITAFLSFIAYISIILLGFAVTSQELAKSGFSTMQFQETSSKEEINIILSAWENYFDIVIRITIFDYLFIIAGFFLFITLNSILIKKLHDRDILIHIPIIGIILTVLSRLSDSLENLWTLLIYNNPDNYDAILIPLMNYTGKIKWIIVSIEYSTLVIGIILVILLSIKRDKPKTNF